MNRDSKLVELVAGGGAAVETALIPDPLRCRMFGRWRCWYFGGETISAARLGWQESLGPLLPGAEGLRHVAHVCVCWMATEPRLGGMAGMNPTERWFADTPDATDGRKPRGCVGDEDEDGRCWLQLLAWMARAQLERRLPPCVAQCQSRVRLSSATHPAAVAAVAGVTAQRRVSFTRSSLRTLHTLIRTRQHNTP